MKCRLLRAMERGCKTAEEERAFRTSGQFPVVAAGTVIDDPEAYQLVRMGIAEAADAECEAIHGMTPETAAAARKAYERVERGIHPTDYAAYDAGEMIGYDQEGNPIPGPNYLPPEQEEAQEEENDTEAFSNWRGTAG